MNSRLAEQILVQIMGWDQEQISVERPLIQALGSLKFDEYQQFSTGMRFTESLVNWLNQFETKEERNIAYNFVKTHLIFITSDQVNHLINICFPEFVDIHLTAKAADRLRIPSYLTTKIHKSKVYMEVKRKALFLGLSDGAKIDQLRRVAQLDNEQVYSSYQISSEKIDDLKKELQEALKQEAKFSSIFLIDDFTASGLSYLRISENKGKLIKFLEKLFAKRDKEHETVLCDLVEIDGLDVHVVFYIATRQALNYLSDGIEQWKTHNGRSFNHSVTAVQVIEEWTAEAVKSEGEFIKLVQRKEYFDNRIVDKHYEKGKIDRPYLGFDECALPVVLYHNTPNNSLPILWFPQDMRISGLFPRVTRHK